MKRDEVIRILAGKRADLSNQFGVQSLTLFGSVARNESTSSIEVNMLVEFNRPVGLFGLFALQNHLETCSAALWIWVHPTASNHV